MCNSDFCCFSAAPGRIVKSANFDFSLFYTLIRNTAPNVRPPSRGWSSQPLPGPLTETDDIERIRQHRNIMAHNTDFKISDSDFNVIWLELSQVCPSLCIFFQSGLYFKRPAWPWSYGSSNYICPSMLITPEVVSSIHAPSPSHWKLTCSRHNVAEQSLSCR